MTATDSAQISDVLNRVRTWTPAMRIVLARKVLETLEAPAISKPPRSMSLDHVIGLLKTETPPPDDPTCRQIVEQERARKYR